MPHSYPINYSGVWFLFSQPPLTDAGYPGMRQSQPAEVLPISPDTTMPRPPSSAQAFSSGRVGSPPIGAPPSADSPSALDCAARAEIVAICSNSASNFDMYENRGNSRRPPQGPGTFFDASHGRAYGYIHPPRRPWRLQSSDSDPAAGRRREGGKNRLSKIRGGILLSRAYKNLWGESSRKEMLNESRCRGRKIGFKNDWDRRLTSATGALLSSRAPPLPDADIFCFV